MHSTLEKIKNKVGRRSSEPAAFDRSLSLSPSNPRSSISTNPVIIIHDDSTPHSRLRAHSLTAANDPNQRSRSVSKKQARQLVKQETSHVIDKKLHQLLGDLGLQLPFPLKTPKSASSGSPSKSIRVSVANSNDCIYLASSMSASFTYADVENGGAEILEASADPTISASGHRDSATARDIALRADPSEESVSDSSSSASSHIHAARSPNYLCTKIDSDTPIPHVFAVIIELSKESAIRDLHIDFLSCVQILWPLSDIHNRSHHKEKFKIGSFDWQCSLSNPDFYINTQNSSDTKSKKIDQNDLARRTKAYRLKSVQDLASSANSDPPRRKGPSLPFDTSFSHSHTAASDASSLTSSSALFETYKPGLYVFLLPLVLPPHMPATVTSINGSLAHRLSVSMIKCSEKLNRRTKINSHYNLPMVRTPPSLANSIADKPIYVNRVWNDALQYVITFPRKYVALGSEHTINVKLVPLVKDVILKRIKFNVLERITYVSKDLRHEYEYDDDDPYLLRNASDNKTRERVVHVCELKTRHKSSYSTVAEPYKEEVIKCPDNNLLFSCYEPKDDPASADPLSKPARSTMVTSPLDINIALPFLTTRNDKVIMTSSVDEPNVNGTNGSGGGDGNAPAKLRRSLSAHRDSILSNPMCPSSPLIGSLETYIANPHNEGPWAGDDVDENELKLDSSALMSDTARGPQENIQQGYTTVSKALAPDSNFRHIQINHRLQVCFRISKPDPKDNNRMHHYEVVVDTPVVLLSAKCNEDSIQLPQYDEINHHTALSPPPPSERGVTFRTPSYNNNGVSIRRLDPEVDDELPTFEEAISATASPRMRSFSVAEDPLSRANSISCSDPAPAYENTPDDYIPPLNIDDLVVDANAPQSVGAQAGGARKQSSLRNALENSFAPPPPPNSSAAALQVPENATAPENTDPLAPSDTTSMDSSSSAGSSASSSSSLDLSLNEISRDRPPTIQNEHLPSIRENSTRDANDGTESIFTQDTPFDQKLPLLQNASTDNVNANSRRPQNNLAKMLTQTLTEGQQVQDFYHPY